MNKNSNSIFNITVLVAALGYFVDIYDLLLFQIVRVDSLKDMGLSMDQVKSEGEFIISVQMIGLLVGGIIWGVMGDKKGRLSVLFGSIVLYSIANIINGFVQTPFQYGLTRFFAGIGLAGELGAGITLVSELVSKEKRGLSTSFVAGIGLTGAVVAYFISQNFHWRTCYFIGGGLGFCLLILRISVLESGMFTKLKELDVQRGNFFMFFTNGVRFKKYILAILIGLPTWYVIGILVAFSNDFGKAFGLTVLSFFLYFNQHNGTAADMYLICFAMGFSVGFWAIFVTMAAEQFGTNLRSTATTTVPNMVRGALPLMFLLFKNLQLATGNYITAGWVTGAIVMTISFTAAWFTEETFGKDLNYVEN